MMRAASAALITLLSTGQYFIGDLFTITLKSGSILRWTNFDQSLTYSSNTWTTSTDNSTQPLISRGEIRNARGTEVGTCDVTLSGGQSSTISGTRLGLFANNGGFDGAQIKIERVFQATAGDTSAGALLLFQGLVASVDPGATTVVLHCKDIMEYLSITMPRNLWQPGCNNQFCDAGCGLSLATLTQAETVQGGSTVTSIVGSVVKADNYFQYGTITFLTGANAGFTTPVRSYAGGIFIPSLTLPNVPSTGDTFSAIPGCARTFAACTAWSNTANFNGFPFVPPPETAF